MTSGFNWYEICEIWLFGPVTKLRIGRRCCCSCASQPVPWRLCANTEAAGLRKEGEGDDLSNSRRGLKQTIKRRLQFRYASTLERSHQATSLLRRASAKHFCNFTALARTRCTGNMGRQIRCWSVVVQFAAKTNCWRSGARFLPRRAAAWCGICAGRSD
jgi:hypothetical protein